MLTDVETEVQRGLSNLHRAVQSKNSGNRFGTQASAPEPLLLMAVTPLP